MKQRASQKGVALITVLLVFFLVTVIATEIATRVYFGIRQTGNQVIAAQAYQYALAGEAFARQVLYRDFEEDESGIKADHAGEAWANLLERYEFDQGVIEIKINDLQGRLNINNLGFPSGESDAQLIEIYRRMLSNIGLESDIISSWFDWMDQDVLPRAEGTEDEGYLALSEPYRTANQPMMHLSELLLTKGMQWPLYEQISPLMVALPEPTAVNINSASAEVIMAVISEVDEAAAERIIKGRGETGYESIELLMEHESMVGLTFHEGDLIVHAEYFEVIVRSQFAGREVWLRSILHRDYENGKIKLISRDRSAQYEPKKTQDVEPEKTQDEKTS